MHFDDGESDIYPDMTDTTQQFDASKVATKLQSDRQSLTWPQRRTLVKSVAEQFELNGPNELLTGLLLLLAGDPKWEVRKDVADCLLLVDDDNFPRLAAKLSQDNNAFVRQSVERALDRRRRGKESVKRKRRGLDQVQDQYANIEKIHGPIAAKKAHYMAERLYDVLVGSTVHDMRNILAPLKSNISSLLNHSVKEIIDPQTLKKKLARMGYQVATLEKFMEDMRTYSQLTPQKRHRERMADLVQEAHDMVLDAFKATGRDPAKVEVSFDILPNLTFDVSRHQIVRAIGNVLKNAYESFAIDPQVFGAGKVRLEARSIDNEWGEIIVCDNGIGLSEEELAEVRRFVPGGTSKKTHGTGFGLPIAKRKIEDHGGSLTIDSKEDEGTRVIITLPLNAGDNDE